MTLLNRYKRLNIWNKLFVWAGFASIAGLTLSLIQLLGSLPTDSSCSRSEAAQAEEFLDRSWALLGGGSGLPRLYKLNENRTQLELARDEIEKALILCPKSPKARRYHSIYLNAIGRRDKAESILRDLAAEEPQDTKVLGELAGVLRQQGKFDESAGYIDQALRLDPDNPALLSNLGLTRKRQARLSEAEDAFRSVLALDPSDANAHLYLAEVLQLQGRVAEAQEEAAKAAKLKPGLRH